jgi:hypothetical protein
MNRLSPGPITFALAVAIVVMAAWCVVLFGNHGPLHLWGGILAKATDQYLDGSGRAFQQCSWHLGNGTRTWGETYGFKVGRFYVSMSVNHVNPRLTPTEAREDE